MSSWNSGFLWVIASHQGICLRSAALLFFSASSSSLEMFLARVSTFFPGRCCSKAFIDPRCYNNNSSLILETVSTDVVTAEFSGVFFGSERKKKLQRYKSRFPVFLSRAIPWFVAVGGRTSQECGGSIFTRTVSALHFTRRCWVKPRFGFLNRLHCWRHRTNEVPEFLRGDFGSYWQGARCSVALLALFK